MQPAMPFGWNSARIIDAVVHDPASRKISNSLATFIIDITVGIMANALPLGDRTKPGPEGRIFPPCEDILENAHAGRLPVCVALRNRCWRHVTVTVRISGFGGERQALDLQGSFRFGSEFSSDSDNGVDESIEIRQF